MPMIIPLAERFRPTQLNEVIGQDHLLGEYGLIAHIIKRKSPLSLLLWGPPGCGKTTLARLYAQAFDAQFVNFSAHFTVQELRTFIQDIQKHPLFQHSILFLDEIHRLNKAQQDLFLPYVEQGVFTLVGATTENPSFALNDALLSRLRVITLKPLEDSGLAQILDRYEKRFQKLPLTQEAKELLFSLAEGDARHFLNMIENIEHLASSEQMIGKEQLSQLLQRRSPLFDKKADGHYNLISALHKSVRGSDPDASLYWLARMLQAGEDPQFIARRIVRMAVEDIGLADPHALDIALNAWRAFDQLGSPEGELALAQALVYLSLAPKSNAVYTAFTAASETARNSSSLTPPKIILNAPTRLMKEMGYGKGYQYDHDLPSAFSGQNYFPEQLERPHFYHPVPRGFEREMQKRLEYFKKLRKEV